MYDNALGETAKRTNTPGRSTGMMFFRNILLVGVLIWGNSVAGVARAQQTPQFDEALARQAYQVAENWVRRARVPDKTLAIEARQLAAVHVTLRRNGPTVGQATASVDDPRVTVADDEAVDAMELVRTAVKAALKDMIVSMDEPVSDLMQITQQLQLDIQFARPIHPVKLTSLAQLPEKIILNLDGLAMHDGRRYAWVFPGNRIAANTNLQGQLNYLLSELNLAPTQLPRVGQTGGPSLFRFSVIHLVQLKPGQPAQSLYRGNMLYPQTPLNDVMLHTLRDQLLGHVLQRHNGEGQFAGTYEPTADRYDPALARPVDSALAAYTLARASQLNTFSDSLRDRMLQACSAAVIEMASSEQDLHASALTLLALLESPEAATLKGSRLRLATALGRMQQHDGSFAMQDQAGSRDATLSGDAIALAALVAYYDRTRDPKVLQQVNRGLKAIWQHIDKNPNEFPSTLPWLAYAHRDLQRLNQSSPHHKQLIDAMQQLDARQVKPWSVDQTQHVALDTVGGYRIGTGLFDEPDWQTGRVLTARALLLGNKSAALSDELRTQWTVQAGLAARFLAQLTMQAPACYYVRNPTEALGGTRMALWDNRQPLYASALSLLAVTELQQSLAGGQ